MRVLLLLSALALLAGLAGCASQASQKRGFLDWNQVVYDSDGGVVCDKPECR